MPINRVGWGHRSQQPLPHWRLEPPHSLLVPDLNQHASRQVDAASLLKTIHLRSCSLVVLSRGGVIDNIRCVEDAEKQITAGVEARRKLVDTDLSNDEDSVPVIARKVSHSGEILSGTLFSVGVPGPLDRCVSGGGTAQASTRGGRIRYVC